MKRGAPLERRAELRRDTEKAREFAGRRSELRTDPEKARGFVDRGRESSARSLERAARRRGGISPASKGQREQAKLATSCIACGRERSEWLALDPAHLAEREAGGCDDVLCTPFALCRAGDGSGCHREFDEGRLDLLKVVNAEPDRYRRALQHALEHLSPLQLVERLAGARTQWSDARPVPWAAGDQAEPVGEAHKQEDVSR